MNLDSIKELRDETTKPCKGLFFRGYSSVYYRNGIIKRTDELRLLKRMSCPGCDKCGWVLDTLSECTDNIIIPAIKNGKIYSIHSINESRDWETRIIDSYDLEFFEVEK